LLSLFIVTFTVKTPAYAKKNFSIIRDAEIENILKSYCAPVFTAVGMNPKNIKIHIVDSDEINAFATAGHNIYFNTGLILETKTPEELIGVIAHETGHVYAGHILTGYEQLKKAQNTSLITTVLGGIAAVASGRPDLGIAVALGGAQVGTENFLHYRRGQESAADQVALNILDANKISAQGFLDFMKTIQRKDMSTGSNIPVYLRTHPVTTDRVEHIRNHINKQNGKTKPLPKSFYDFHKTMKAKLFGFLKEPTRTFNTYKGDSYFDKYARAVAFHKNLQEEEALKEIDSLIKDYPKNPYLYELKGQIFFENGQIDKSIKQYEQAIKLYPDNGLLRLSLSQALIEKGGETAYKKARTNLEKAIKIEQQSPAVWKLLAISYKHMNNNGLYSYAMSEYLFLIHGYKDALFHAKLAEKQLKYGSPKWMKVQDIISRCEQIQRKENLKKNRVIRKAK
jgi:predicted Zn-dependent protease